jgi:hypothetical protein
MIVSGLPPPHPQGRQGVLLGAAGQFVRVPVLNGTNNQEGRWFVTKGAVLNNGGVVFLSEPVTADSYQRVIAAMMGVSAGRAAEYSPGAYPLPVVAFSALVGDATFACPALQIDRWTSPRVPTFACECNDDAAPPLFLPPGLITPPMATHGSELQYLFDLPNQPPAPLSADQQARAASMRAALGQLRGQWQPGVGIITLAGIRRRQQRPDAVAGAATATGRDGLRHQTPLLILGRYITTPRLGPCRSVQGDLLRAPQAARLSLRPRLREVPDQVSEPGQAKSRRRNARRCPPPHHQPRAWRCLRSAWPPVSI